MYNVPYLEVMKLYNTLILIILSYIKYAFNKKVNPSTTQNLVFLECLIP